MTKEVTMNIPPAMGYILVDSKKCQGCQCCMMACSLVHEGEVNLSLDESDGSIRIIDESKCTVCLLCINVCLFQPHRIIWNHEMSRVIKCDMCINTPYWDEKGGPEGRQICVEIYPQGALKFTDKVPDQTDDSAYDVDLRENVPR